MTNQVDLDRTILEDLCESTKQQRISFTESEVKEMLLTLKNGKAADSTGITSEHLKNGGDVIVTVLTKLINNLCKNTSIPDMFKLGLVTPVHKRKGTPLQDPNSYRKITVTNVTSKLFEKLHLKKCEEILTNNQSQLQRGFTKGVSPTNAALIITEIMSESKENKQDIYLAFLDAQKAFDRVWHSSLLRRIYFSGIEGDLSIFSMNYIKIYNHK